MHATAANCVDKRPSRLSTRHWPVACFLAVLILGLVARNDSWIYTQIGWLDPWTYVGFGYSYDHPRFAADSYKIARLPWILAEFYTRHLFDAVSSQYILQLGCLFLQGFFFYLAVVRLLGSVPALVGAAFLVTLPFIHGAGGADYNTTLSGPLYALSFYVLTVGANLSRAPLALLFGVCFGLLLHTNIVYVNLLVPLSIHFIGMRWRSAASTQARSIFAFAAIAILGALLVTVALGALNRSYGREWLFFAGLFKFVTAFALDSSQQKPWWQPWSSGWYGNEAYMGLLSSGLFAAIGLLALSFGKRDVSIVRFQIVNLCSQYLAVCVVWTAWQTMGQTALQPAYFAYPLWIPLACVVSSVTVFACGPAPRINRIVLAAATLVGCISPYWIHWPPGWAGKSVYVMPFFWSLSLYLAVFAAGLLLGSLGLRVGVYALVVLLGSANALVNEKSIYYRAAECTDRRDAELALIAAHNAIDSINPDFSKDVFVWRNPDDGDVASMSKCSLMPARFFGDSLAWSGWSYLDDARPFKPIPEISSERLRFVAARDPIIVLVTDDPGFAIQLRNRVSHLGKDFSSMQQIWISQGAVKVPLFIFQ
jgi:hypothetical protein